MKKILNLTASLFLLAGFSSCLKDTPIIGPDAPGAVTHVIEFLNPAVITSNTTSTIPVYTLSYDIGPSVDLDLQIGYSGGGGAPNDIHVKVGLAADKIETINEEQETDMEAIPENAFSITSYDVTIPKGQKTGTLKVTFKPEEFDLSADYVLVLKIESVTGTKAPISGNFGLIALNVGAKNQWDGVYKVTGTTVDANGLYKGVYPTQAAMISAGANSTLYYNVEIDYPNFLVENISTGGLANTGIRPKFTIDKTTNNVVITNGASDITVKGKYDPEKRSFEIEWQLGRWHTTEKWEYLEPR